jgi:DNA polymerase-4
MSNFRRRNSPQRSFSLCLWGLVGCVLINPTTSCGSAYVGFAPADRVASRLRTKYRPGRTVTVRVRFGDLRSVTRSVALDAPISATVVLSEIAEELVRKVLAQHPDEKTMSLVAISVSQLEKLWDVQLELPLGLEDEERRPGSKRGMARWMADRAVDMIRDRFVFIGFARQH